MYGAVVKTFGRTNFSTMFQKCNRQLRNVGNCIHKKALRLPMIFLYNCNQRRICVFDCRRYSLYKQRNKMKCCNLYLLYRDYMISGTTLTKIMFMSEDTMIVGDAIRRIDEVLGEKPLSESRTNHISYDNSITLEHVSYSYDGKKSALNDISLSIKSGEVVARWRVRSGGGKTRFANIITRFLTRKRAHTDRKY